MKKLPIPQFANEAEEAGWWYAHKDMVEANLAEAVRAGKLKAGTAKRPAAEARASKNITVSMPLADLERARNLAAKKGLGYQTYIKLLLRDAFDREEVAARRKSSRKTA